MSLYNSRYIKANQTISLNDFTSFILSDVVTDEKYSSKIDNESKEKLKVVNGIIKNTNSGIKYNDETMPDYDINQWRNPISKEYKEEE